MNDKILTLLGFMSKAGKLTVGSDKVIALLKENKALFVLIASDVSKKSEKELLFAAKGKIPVYRSQYSIDVLSHATGRVGGVFATADRGFADAIKGGIADGKN